MTKKPHGLAFETAAACGVSGLVAVSAMKALRVHAGLRIVVVGATGGIGAMATQLAARTGAKVIGVCGPASAKRAYALGCSLVLDYSRGSWDSALAARREPCLDRVLDVVGGRDTEQMGRRVLKPDGIFVTVVGPERFVGDKALGWTGVLSILGHVGYRMIASYLRGPRYVVTGPGPGGGSALSDVAAAANGVVPPTDSVVPFELEPMRQALKRAAAHQNSGRIVLEMSQER